jgi:hypothetical protein
MNFSKQNRLKETSQKINIISRLEQKMMALFSCTPASEMTITNLPKDILGLIFSQLWDATGVPLTCKLFAFILK